MSFVNAIGFFSRQEEWKLNDLDNNEYPVITIGSQAWIGSNLKVTKYSDGSDITNITDGPTFYADLTGAYCWYNNDISYKTPYGALYNHYSISNAKGIPYFTRGGVHESGWRIPTQADFEALVEYLGGWAVAGGKLKEIGVTHWNYSDYENIGASNSSKFSAVGAGYRTDSLGSFFNFGLYGVWWSSTNYYLGTFKTAEEAHHNTSGFRAGRSIRCVKDI